MAPQIVNVADAVDESLVASGFCVHSVHENHPSTSPELERHAGRLFCGRSGMSKTR